MRVSAMLSVVLVLMMGLVMPAIQAQDKKAEVANVISLVPADPVMVVVVPSVEGLSEKFDSYVDAFAQAGINMPPDAKGALLKEVKEEGVDKYLDLSAPVVFAQMGKFEDDDWETDVDESMQNSIIMVKVKNAELMATELGLKGTGVMKVEPKDGMDDAPSYVTLSNGYALFADNEAALKNYKAANAGGAIYKSMGKINQSMLYDSDFVLYANMSKVKELSKEDVAEGLKELEEEMLMGVPEEYSALNKALIGIVKNLVTDFFNDAESGVVGFKLTNAGARLSYGIQFKDGEFSKLFANAPADSTLNRLPNTGYFMASSYSVDPKPYVTMLTPMMDKLIDSTDDKEFALPLLQMYKKSIAAAGSVTGQQFMWAAPDQPDLMGLTQLVGVQVTNDAAGILAIQKENMKVMKDIGDKVAKENDQQAPEFTYEEKIMEMEGRQVDKYKSSFPQEVLDMMGPAQAVLGAGLDVYLSPGKDNLVYGMTKDLALFKKVLEASGGQGTLFQNPGIKAVQPLLRGDRGLELYINLGQIYKSANDFSNALQGQPLPLELAADMEPLTITGSQNAGGAVVDVIITKKTMIQFMKLSEFGQAMGGGGLPF